MVGSNLSEGDASAGAEGTVFMRCLFSFNNLRESASQSTHRASQAPLARTCVPSRPRYSYRYIGSESRPRAEAGAEKTPLQFSPLRISCRASVATLLWRCCGKAAAQTTTAATHECLVDVAPSLARAPLTHLLPYRLPGTPRNKIHDYAAAVLPPIAR